jgi:hypothetical protein
MLAAAVIAAAVAWYMNLPAGVDTSTAVVPAHIVPTTTAVTTAAKPMLSRPAEPDRAGERVRIDTLFADIDRRFVAEALDVATSSQTRIELESALEDPLLNRFGAPVGRRIDCRGRLCRIELRFADRAHADDWSMFYPVQTAATLSRVRTRMDVAADESATLVIYGSRPGAEFLLGGEPAAGAAGGAGS